MIDPAKPETRLEGGLQKKGLRWFSFFLSALLFWSGFFSLLAPLPLLITAVSLPPVWWLMALISNSALIYLVLGKASFLFYSVFVLAPAVMIPLLFRRSFSLNSVILYTLAAMVVVAFVIWSAHSLIQGLSPWSGFKVEVGRWIDFIAKTVPEENLKTWFQGLSPDEMKEKFLVQFPSSFLIVSLMLIWANVLIVLQINAGGVRDHLGLAPGFFKHWRTPEFFLWPTIVFAGAMIFLDGWIQDIGLNGFKVMMSLYAVQGLAILTYFFDAWGIRGLFRAAAFMVVLLFMLPLVLSLGFFDLWFDFRSKLRQT
jgi:hypothetical protein